MQESKIDKKKYFDYTLEEVVSFGSDKIKELIDAGKKTLSLIKTKDEMDMPSDYTGLRKFFVYLMRYSNWIMSLGRFGGANYLFMSQNDFEKMKNLFSEGVTEMGFTFNENLNSELGYKGIITGLNLTVIVSSELSETDFVICRLKNRALKFDYDEVEKYEKETDFEKRRSYKIGLKVKSLEEIDKFNEREIVFFNFEF